MKVDLNTINACMYRQVLCASTMSIGSGTLQLGRVGATEPLPEDSKVEMLKDRR